MCSHDHSPRAIASPSVDTLRQGFKALLSAHRDGDEDRQEEADERVRLMLKEMRDDLAAKHAAILPPAVIQTKHIHTGVIFNGSRCFV